MWLFVRYCSVEGTCTMENFACLLYIYSGWWLYLMHVQFIVTVDLTYSADLQLRIRNTQNEALKLKFSGKGEG